MLVRSPPTIKHAIQNLPALHGAIVSSCQCVPYLPGDVKDVIGVLADRCDHALASVDAVADEVPAPKLRSLKLPVTLNEIRRAFSSSSSPVPKAINIADM